MREPICPVCGESVADYKGPCPKPSDDLPADLVERCAEAIWESQRMNEATVPWKYLDEVFKPDFRDDASAVLREAGVAEMAAALEAMLHAVCGETGFANAVRVVSGTAYPWDALDLAEAEARAALSRYQNKTCG